MNDTILSFLSVLAVYGLSTLALPCGGRDRSDDSLDIAALEDIGSVTPESDNDEQDRPIS